MRLNSLCLLYVLLLDALCWVKSLGLPKVQVVSQQMLKAAASPTDIDEEARFTTIAARTREKIAGKSIRIGILASVCLSPPSRLIVQADSTGKFSTKMTAKKRYLPRIQSGVARFNSVIGSDEETDMFIEEEVEKLMRAMDLYGASLRKGETPDEISRTATKLTQNFGTAMANLKRTKSTETRAEARRTLDTYLTFAKLTTSTSKTPADQVQ